jgi:hypothetical protein
MINCSCRNKHALSVSWSAAAVETNMLCVCLDQLQLQNKHDSFVMTVNPPSSFITRIASPPVFILSKLVECLSKSVYICLSSMTNSKECLGRFLNLEVISWLDKNHSREYATLILQLTFCPWDEASSFSTKEADLCLCASSLFLPVCNSTKSVYTVQTHTHVCTYSSLFDLREELQKGNFWELFMICNCNCKNSKNWRMNQSSKEYVWSSMMQC